MKLYKFIGLGSTYGRKNCVEILKNSRIWAPSFSELNDPFEFRFIQSDQSRQEELKSFFDSLSHGVVSFSTGNQDLLMWSHYGSSHRGVCFEFETEGDEQLSAVRAVKYGNTVPPFNPNSPEEYYYCKHSSWGYEKEVRLVIQDRAGTLITFAPNSLKAVYYGLNVSLDDISDIDSWASGRGIKRYLADRVRNDYGLTFKEVKEVKDLDRLIKLSALEKLQRKYEEMTVKKFIEEFGT